MENTITLITGGSGGIGKSVVRRFLENQDRVIVLDVNEIIEKDIKENQHFEFIKTDVTNIQEIEKAKEIIEQKYGYIDNIISMAGVNMKSEIGGMETITLEDIDKSIKLNLNSHLYIVKIMLELLKKNKKNRETITMISSINAICSYGLPAYSAAKAGIYGFMNAIVKQMGESHIRVNTISLGTVPHMHEIIEGNEYFENHKNNLAIKEFVRPMDVADTIYALVNITKCITGQNIILDMGQST